VILHAATFSLAALVLVASGTSAAVAAQSATTPPPGAPSDPKVVAREREALRNRLEALKKDIAEQEEAKSDAADALKESEQTISRTNRRLTELSAAQAKARAELDAKNSQIATQEAVLARRQDNLGDLLRKQYATGGITPWSALLSGDDPQRLGRNLSYLGYVSQARAAAVVDLRSELEQLNQLRNQADNRRAELDTLAKEESRQREELLKQSAERRKVMDTISAQLDSQRKEATAVARDEQRLSRVIDDLTRMLARQAEEARQKRIAEQKRREDEARRVAAAAAAEARRAEAAAKAQAQAQARARAEAARQGRTPPPEPPPVAVRPAPPPPPPETAVARNDDVPDASLSGQFEKLRGRLRLPVRGDVVGRFGSPRGEGGSWRGVFIRAGEGTTVHAVAPGKVVFADWLRGFGNLVIVDHGSQYLSIYGNNQSILKHVGDSISSGDVIANVGATGGQSESGLYFELRFRGAPFDPLKWTALR
jgi:septal ring factor EnvC (AmiA/AmiB activator)